ncbi:MAG: glycosyltransferase family 2 protein [Pseudooceanicola sp.]
MLRRVYRIFLRYADQALTLTRPGGHIVAPGGAGIGDVTGITIEGSRLVIRGHAHADRVGIRINRTERWGQGDPTSTGGGREGIGFTLDIPAETGALEILIDRGGQIDAVAFDGFSERRLALGRIGLILRFLIILVGLAPWIYRWKWQGDLGAREEVKKRLRLVPQVDAALMHADVLRAGAQAGQGAHGAQGAVIIVPVYNAFDLLPEMFDRVAKNTDADWRMVIVEDASSDARVRPFLRDWIAGGGHAHRVTLLCNDENLGFIGSVNRAFATIGPHSSQAVVLLNTDAMVPKGWLSRLLAPLADPSVASVTPMSNDAEIFTVPVICARGDLRPGEGDALDAAAGTLSGAVIVEAPTGVGFCMALSGAFLDRAPRFDTSFGRGYGEETDWCQKTRAMGGRHVCVQNLFVEHRGGASFGSAAKQRLLERNCAEITRRYPRYDDEVQEFVRNDPLTTGRLALGMAWASGRQAGPVPIYLAHVMGGGADHHLQGMIRADLATGGSAVVVRVGQWHRWQVELHCPHGVTRGLTDDADLLRDLLGRLTHRRVVYSCGVGDRDPVALPGLLRDLAGGDADAGGIEVLIHDFFPISPSYTLLGQDGVFHGVPRAGDADGAGGDPAHGYRRPDGSQCDLAMWQAAWGGLISAADTVTVFSDNSRRILIEAYPQAAATIRVTPHKVAANVPRIPPGGGTAKGGVMIGVLGNIGVHKGIAVVQRLSREIARDGTAGVVVLGETDPGWPLAAPAKVHGGYRIDDLAGLVARYRVDCWLIPSVWPETFSFTTHEALATGLPVFAFDIGAQGDAVRQAENGIILPNDMVTSDGLAAHIQAELAARGIDASQGRGPRS